MNRPEHATFINDYEVTDFISWTVFSCFLNIRNRNISIQKYSLLLTHFFLNNLDIFSISTSSHQATFLLPISHPKFLFIVFFFFFFFYKQSLFVSIHELVFNVLKDYRKCNLVFKYLSPKFCSVASVFPAVFGKSC